MEFIGGPPPLPSLSYLLANAIFIVMKQFKLNLHSSALATLIAQYFATACAKCVSSFTYTPRTAAIAAALSEPMQ